MKILFCVYILLSWSLSLACAEESTGIAEEGIALRTPVNQRGVIEYPVDVTGVLIPFDPFSRALEDRRRNWMESLVFGRSFQGLDDFYDWFGLSAPQNAPPLLFSESSIKGGKNFLGPSAISKRGVQGLTFSCAACHSDNFFGKTIVGLGNKRSRANKLYDLVQSNRSMVSLYLGEMTEAESDMWNRSSRNLSAVGAKKPVALGLDTSLAQVAYSLERRSPDHKATKDIQFEKSPRDFWPPELIADSKPAVWWNVRYKNRWLSDGSFVGASPVIGTILWNEIGRGTDLEELESWLDENRTQVENMHQAVFESEAPTYGEIFGWDDVDLEEAKRGQKVYQRLCADCHGNYLKGWDRDSEEFGSEYPFATIHVDYPADAPNIDVGTDPGRYEGMHFLAPELNRLSIVKRYQMRFVPAKGYVAPPLVGIFARYPYLHNSSVPSLSALLSPAEERPKIFYQGPTQNRKSDFDDIGVGYPVGESIPESWKHDDAKVDTSMPGLSNMGHDIGIIRDRAGNDLLSAEEKKSLISFLKTL